MHVWQVPAQTKPDIVVSVVWIVVVAIRDPTIVVIVVPGAATNHSAYDAGPTLSLEDTEKFEIPI